MIDDTESKRYDESFLQNVRALFNSQDPIASGPYTTATRSDSNSGGNFRTVSVQVDRPWKAVYEVVLDLTKQVLQLDTHTDYSLPESTSSVPAPIYPSFAATGAKFDSFLPAATLAMKAKCFDDGLYAAVELAADNGAGSFRSRVGLLNRLLDQLLVVPSDEGSLESAALLTAALRLGGEERTVPVDVAEAADELQREFNGDERRSKPLGFYTWSDTLQAIFRRDRLLQTELQPASIDRLSETLSSDGELMAAYGAMLGLAESLTNPFVRADLRRANASSAEAVPASFLPPTRAPETELIKRLYGDRSIPDGFDLADEMAKRIRAGILDLTPATDSGWYDHQLYALESLVALNRSPEYAKVQATRDYQDELLGLFKALLASTRETHVKHADIAMAGACMGPPDVVLIVCPCLSVEPLPTYYLRRARSYRFVRDVLTGAFGADGLVSVRRLSAAGPLNLPLLEELRIVESLFRGAYLVACEEIGMAPDPQGDLEGGVATGADRDLLKSWTATIDEDPDLGTDVRMMVPVFYDIERGKTKVWTVLGVAVKDMYAIHDKPPVVMELRDASGATVDQKQFRVLFGGEGHELSYLVTAELYVTELLDRAEFRAHCDRYKTQEAIVANLR